MIWQARKNASLSVLNFLISRWDSTEMRRTRAIAAGVILNNQPFAPYVDDVLDFFETVAMFWRKGDVGIDVVWHIFSLAMECYWLRLATYIRDAQKDDPKTWQDWSALMQEIISHEDRPPSPEDIGEFLQEETKRYRAESPHSS